MSDATEAGHNDRQQIIIVRRGRGGEDAHHGGVWKIAFADFMTAMMAFFLVMWLTQSSDTATRQQVAQYFNPIKLNDASPATRGVETSDEGAARTEPTEGVSKDKTHGDPQGKPLAGDEEGGEEQALFRDPYAVIAEIAAEGASVEEQRDRGKLDGSGLPGLNGGDAYRDPFDPASWQLSPNTVEAGGDIDAVPPAEFKTAVLPPEPVPALDDEGTETADASKTTEGAAEGKDLEQPEEKHAPVEQDEPSDAKKPAREKARGEAATLRADLEAELAKAGQTLPKNVEIAAQEGGLVISLGDDIASGMFEIGSAKPTAPMVAMMEKIAAVLKERPGELVIRGHTDSRPFRSETYDNWRLSSARAQMAYYMLSRGGLDQSRVMAIEGVADREPKIPGDPEAAANRRIEILLRTPEA